MHSRCGCRSPSWNVKSGNSVIVPLIAREDGQRSSARSATPETSWRQPSNVPAKTTRKPAMTPVRRLPPRARASAHAPCALTIASVGTSRLKTTSGAKPISLAGSSHGTNPQ